MDKLKRAAKAPTVRCSMSIIVLFLLVAEVRSSQVRLIQRDVRTSSLQDHNRFIITFETVHPVTIDAPDFAAIETLLDERKSSIREHTTWLVRRLPAADHRELVRYDEMRHGFVIGQNDDLAVSVNKDTGQLTLSNTNDGQLLHNELIMHAESGLSQSDEIIRDVYRFARLLPTSLRCTTNVTIHANETNEISCSIDYEFLHYEDWNGYQPTINLVFYRQQNNSSSTLVAADHVYDERQSTASSNRTLIWTRTIRYTMNSVDKTLPAEAYICVVIPDTSKNVDPFHDQDRLCRTSIHVQREDSSVDYWDLIDMLMMVLIALTSMFFLTSLILCAMARRSRSKRMLQIIPENKTTPLPMESKHDSKFFANNNEVRTERASLDALATHRHKPGCPQYVPLPADSFLSNDLFTHTTIDNIKKIILPDIPETTDLLDDQTYVRVYLPPKQAQMPVQFVAFDKSSSMDS